MTAVIAFNCLALRPGGSGVQTYIRELLRGLPGEVDATLIAKVQSEAAGELPAGVQARVVPSSVGVRRALQGFTGVGASDLVHGLDVDLPLRPGAPTVATVHDLSVFDVPWAFSRRRVTGERWLVRRTMRHADALISVSAFTAERVKALFGRDSAVTPLAPRRGFAPPSPEAIVEVRTRYGLPARHVLHVGTIEPRKDVPTLIAACARAGVPVVLAGGGDHRAAHAAGALTIGYVPSDDLPALYGGATVVAYPSRYEGFGLPPLEAMACGAAVVASSVGALPDVLAGAAELVPPGDADRLTAALRALLDDDDRRRHLGAAGVERAAAFSWHATAAGTAAVYRSLGVAC